MQKGFWENLKAPIIGLSPMDGVTDAPMRFITCKYSTPSLVMTEFTNVEGLARGAVKMLRAFYFSETERPVIAQIYGVEIESFYKATVLMCYLGFDGIDINMGCPANKVAKRGSGAALIKTPVLAKTIIETCKKAAEDWSNGITLEEGGVHENIIEAAKEMAPKDNERKHIPISVKTRIGFDEPVPEEWTKHLLETEPANISMHGRTLKQLYAGMSNWDEIKKCADLVRPTETMFLGNGDILSVPQAKEYIEKYNLDGVLVGRATMGNPWFFDENKDSTILEKLQVAYEHSKYQEDNYPEIPFVNLRKHMAWYCKDFDGAKSVRTKMIRVNNSKDVKEIVDEFISSSHLETTSLK